MVKSIGGQKPWTDVLKEYGLWKVLPASFQQQGIGFRQIYAILFGSKRAKLPICDKKTSFDPCTEGVVSLQKSKEVPVERDRTLPDNVTAAKEISSEKPDTNDLVESEVAATKEISSDTPDTSGLVESEVAATKEISSDKPDTSVLYESEIAATKEINSDTSDLVDSDFIGRQRWGVFSKIPNICNCDFKQAVFGFLLVSMISGMTCSVIPSSPLVKMVQVSRCPTNKSEWLIAATIKNCSKENDVVYHCLIDEHLSKMVEICARARRINGYMCAEYNTYGKRIQASSAMEASCRNFTTPCKRHYYSNEAYMYQECYNLVQKEGKSEVSPDVSHPSPTSKKLLKEHKAPNNHSIDEVSWIHNSTTNKRSSSDVKDAMAILVPLCVIFAVIVIVLIALNRCRKRKDNNTDKSDEDESIEQVMLAEKDKEVNETA